jgi:HSP20 family protein
MMLARWNPWRELFDLEREMSDLTRRVFGGGTAQGTRRDSAVMWTPAVDVLSRQGDLVVRAEIPGVDPNKDIEISLEDGLLTIRGERRHEEKSEEDDYLRFESSYGSFQRSIPLPESVKPEDVKARYEHGILEVVVPQAAQVPSAKKIPIAVGNGEKALDAKGSKK